MYIFDYSFINLICFLDGLKEGCVGIMVEIHFVLIYTTPVTLTPTEMTMVDGSCSQNLLH